MPRPCQPLYSDDHTVAARFVKGALARDDAGSLGVIGDLLDAQRTLSQRTLERVRRIELQLGVEPSHYEPGAARGRGDREPLEV